MGTLVRQRLLRHLSREQPSVRCCSRIAGLPSHDNGHLRCTLGFATAAETTKDEESPSWFQKLKGAFKGKSSTETQSATSSVEAPVIGELTMEGFADELKKARRFGSLTTFGRGLPRGGEMSAVKSLQKQEDILRALHKRDPVRVGAIHKTEVAAECGCTVNDVENVVAKFEWAKEANRRVMKLKEEGKPLPKSLNEVEALMGKSWNAAASVNLARSGNISRNAPCPCGSQKKYKRCCGKSAG